jgi:hypothetical protein
MTAMTPGDRRWSARAPSMANFGTGVDKRRWGAVELHARPDRRRKGVRAKENGRWLRSALFEALQWHGAVGGGIWYGWGGCPVEGQGEGSGWPTTAGRGGCGHRVGNTRAGEGAVREGGGGMWDAVALGY